MGKREEMGRMRIAEGAGGAEGKERCEDRWSWEAGGGGAERQVGRRRVDRHWQIFCLYGRGSRQAAPAKAADTTVPRNGGYETTAPWIGGPGDDCTLDWRAGRRRSLGTQALKRQPPEMAGIETVRPSRSGPCSPEWRPLIGIEQHSYWN